MATSFNYFNIKNSTGRIGSLQTFKYPQAVPTTTNGLIDVFNDLPWKLTKQNEEIPSIILEEYELTYGRLTSSLLRLAQNVSGAINSGSLGDPYQILYNGKETGFRYHLPYIVPGQIRGAISHTYVDDTNPVLDFLEEKFPTVTGIAKAGAEFVAGMNESGVQLGMEQIKKYGNTASRSISIKFFLYNTVDLESTNNNFSFVSLIQFQNLKTRTSFMTQKPPCIYKVSSNAEGGVYMPAATMDLDVKSVGTLRSMSEFGFGGSVASSIQRLLPEAYEINMTLTELIPQSTNIMMGEIGDKRVEVIGNVSSTVSRISNAVSNDAKADTGSNPTPPATPTP